MVGSKGRGKDSTLKSKYESLSPVPAIPEPLNVEQSADSSLVGEEKNDEIPNKDDKLTNMEERDDTFDGLVIGDGLEEMRLPEDDINDEEKDVANDLDDKQIDEGFTGGIKLDTEAVNDGGDVANKVDAKDIEETTNEEDSENVSDGGGADVNVKENEEKTNKEVQDEGKKPINDDLVCNDTTTGGEKRILEVAEESKKVINEGLAPSEQKLTDDIENEGRAHTLKDEEPMASIEGNEEVECARDDASIDNNINAAPENSDKPKRKLIKKKVVKKKMVPKKDVASMIHLTRNGISGDANQVETNEHGKNDDTTEVVEQAIKKNMVLKEDVASIIHSTDNGISGDANEHGNNDEKTEIKQAVKVKGKPIKLRKEVLNCQTGVADAADNEQNPKLPNNELGNEVHKETSEEEVKDAEAAKSGKKKKKKKKVTNHDTGNVVSGDINKLGPSQKSKSSKKIDSMGMIFMCSSETKKDCYRYKVLGLPAGKKDFVRKIYKGMRLFLFDFKLRLMYGIYKAAGPGGYNIEPRAFKSQFPSQVRFTVLEECIPLAEEKFRKVMKDNYYTKNKFNCELTSEQVKNLCKLFKETTKRADSKKISLNQIALAPSSAPRDRKRKRVEDGRKTRPTTTSSKQGRKVLAVEEVRPRPMVTNGRHIYHLQHQPPVYERQTYIPPTAPTTIYMPLPAHSSSYSYGRDPILEHRELGLSSFQEPRRPIELDRRNVYVEYREPPRTYPEPAYEIGVRRDHYETGTRRPEHHDGGRVVYYRPAEYRQPLPSFRRY